MGDVERLTAISARVPEAMRTDLEAMAKSEDRDISYMVRKLLGPAIRAEKAKRSRK